MGSLLRWYYYHEIHENNNNIIYIYIYNYSNSPSQASRAVSKSRYKKKGLHWAVTLHLVALGAVATNAAGKSPGLVLAMHISIYPHVTLSDGSY